MYEYKNAIAFYILLNSFYVGYNLEMYNLTFCQLQHCS